MAAHVKMPDGFRQAQVLRLLDEVKDVAAEAAAEAPKPLRVFVDREAALRLIVEWTKTLADPALPLSRTPDASTVSPRE